MPSAENLAAFTLTSSPAVPIAALAALLTIIYAGLTRFIRVAVPPAYDFVESEDEETDVAPLAVEAPARPPAPVVTAPESQQLTISAVVVRGIPLAVGDTSSHAMRAFRAGEGELRPLIERNSAGQAAHVTRSYMVGRTPLTLEFSRNEAGQPLRLESIELSLK